MMTFEDFLLESVAKGEAVDLVFEQRLFELAGTLHRIAQPLEREHIPHELIGGLAVLIHVEEADPTHAMLTGHVKASQAAPNPAIDLVRKKMLGQDVSVVALLDLVRMKLSAYRLKDQVHVQVLDAAGLITPAVEQALPEELQSRLRHVRETE